MMLHEWLRLEEISRDDVDPTDEDDPMSSRAYNFLVHYSEIGALQEFGMAQPLQVNIMTWIG